MKIINPYYVSQSENDINLLIGGLITVFETSLDMPALKLSEIRAKIVPELEPLVTKRNMFLAMRYFGVEINIDEME